jgi:serine/threonine protein kinase
VSGEFPLAPGDPGSFTTGSQIAGYQLMEQIGRGGMAVVYKAMDLRLDRPVALKILAPELARDEAFRQRFIRESRAAAAVDHPCIIPVFDAGEASGVLFIAMRYVSGRDLRTLLDREGSLPAGRVVSIVDQVASALDSAHERGLVHRDVKPANMLLDSAAGSGQLDHVYLSDFGLMKRSLSTSSLTSTGQFLGTLDYIAPEQIEGRQVDGRADLYALACTAYEMLAGAPPFRRDQDVAVIWAQVSAPPPQLTDQRPDLPAAVDTVLAKALAKVPGDRYDTCLEFAGALRAACALSASSASSVPGRPGPATELAHLPADAWAGSTPGTDEASGTGGTAARYDRPPAGALPPEPPTEGAGFPPVRPASQDPRRPPEHAPAGAGFGRAEPAEFRPAGYAPPYAPPSGYPPSPRQAPPARPGVRSSRRRGSSRRTPAVIIVSCLVIAGAAFAVLHARAVRSRPPLTSASVSGTVKPRDSAPSAASQAAAGAPATTVTAYFAALNARDYTQAWNLGGRNTGSSYTAYVNGFGTTARNTVTVLSVAGNVVTARITALQTDGTVKTFQGNYTVTGGVITQFNVQQTG